MNMTGKRSAYERLKKFRKLKRRKVHDDGKISNLNSEDNIFSDDTISASKSLIEEVDQELQVPIPEDSKFFETEFQTLNSDSFVHDLESEIDTEHNILSDTCTDFGSEIGEARSEIQILSQQSFNKLSLREKLVKWAIENLKFLPHTVVDELLQLLRSEGHDDLPKTAETLLKTKRAEGAVTEMLSKKGKFGEYVYLGIKSGLSRIVKSDFNEDIFKVIANIDGLPLFNKSDIEMTPILMQVFHPDYFCTPFIVALYSGNSKPDSPNEFLNDFVEECLQLIKSGVEIDSKKYDFDLKGLVCDTPARAFIKCTKGHTGFHACERCTIKGETVRTTKDDPKSQVRVYPDIDCPRRTKKSFKKQSQPEHHHDDETSPLLRIHKFDPVRGVLLDSMHLLAEGAMKLILQKLLFGKNRSKLSREDRKLLSQLLDQLSASVPDEFQRSCFPLEGLANWKATQYRFILLYAGPLIFRKVLPPNYYRHFLLLHSACGILFNRELAVKRVDEAEDFLREFVSKMPLLYGKSSLVMNIHNLIHVADDVRYMQAPLSDYSAFPFENSLGKIKSLVRSAKKVVAQVFRRSSEIEVAGSEIIMRYPLISNANKTKEHSYNSEISYTSVEIKKFQIGTMYPNNLVQLNSGHFFQVTRIVSRTDELDLNNFFMEGFIISKVENVFEKPIKSEEIGIYKIRKMPSTNEVSLKSLCMSEIKRKCILMIFGKKSYIVSLLHI